MFNVSKEQLQSTQDAAYAYSGYAPLIVRILEEGDRVRWAGWNKTFDGPVGGECLVQPYLL